MHNERITADFYRGHSRKIRWHLQQHNYVFRVYRASRRQPFVCELPEQRPIHYNFSPRDRKGSAAELEPPAEFAPLPWPMRAIVGLLPVADPGIIVALEDIQNQQTQDRIADRDESSLKCGIQKMRCVMTVPAL